MWLVTDQAFGSSPLACEEVSSSQSDGTQGQQASSLKFAFWNSICYLVLGAGRRGVKRLEEADPGAFSSRLCERAPGPGGPQAGQRAEDPEGLFPRMFAKKNSEKSEDTNQQDLIKTRDM